MDYSEKILIAAGLLAVLAAPAALGHGPVARNSEGQVAAARLFTSDSAPDGLVVEGDRLVGLRFRRTKMDGGRLVATEETYERRGTYVISSIGSIPDAIPGIPMKGELFAFTDWDLGRLADWPSVFSAGNVVTGKGNIVASRKHATHVAERMVADLRERAGALAQQVAVAVAAQPPHEAAADDALSARIRARQDAVGYPGDYATWIARVTPPDLE